VGIAPDVDPRFERLYGYLNDDVSRRRPTVGLTFELRGISPFDPAARFRLALGAPLLRAGLVHLEDADRPFLSRTLVVPDRVTAYLLGDDTPDQALHDVLVECPAFEIDGSVVDRALEAGTSVVYLKERTGSAARCAAVDGLARHGAAALVLDLERVAADSDPEYLVKVAGREARMQDAGLVAGPVDALATCSLGALRALVALPGPIVLTGKRRSGNGRRPLPVG
jgi:hypothetical protein